MKGKIIISKMFLPLKIKNSLKEEAQFSDILNCLMLQPFQRSWRFPTVEFQLYHPPGLLVFHFAIGVQGQGF
jgi:hypothetical protein